MRARTRAPYAYVRQAFHFHCNEEAAKMLRLEAGDDASSVRWIDVSTECDAYAGLYASHKDWVDKVAEQLTPHPTARDSKRSQKLHGYPARKPVKDEFVDWQVEWPGYSPPTHTQQPLVRPEDLPEQFLPGVRSSPTRANARHSIGHCASSSGAFSSSSKRLRRGSAPSSMAQSLSWPQSLCCAESPNAARTSIERSAQKESRASRWAGPKRGDSDVGKAAEVRVSLNEDNGILRDGRFEQTSTGQIVARSLATGDPEHPWQIEREEWSQRRTYEAPIRFDDKTRAPLNPRGRTGLQGRGCLHQWGPNHVCEPIITRFHPRNLGDGTKMHDVVKLEVQEERGRKQGTEAATVASPTRPSARLSNTPSMWRSASSRTSRTSRTSTPGEAADQQRLSTRRRSLLPIAPFLQIAKASAAETEMERSWRVALQGVQVLAFKERNLDGSETGGYAVPRFSAEPGAVVAAEVRAALYNEAALYEDPETVERLQHLIQEACDSSTASEIYRGYLDDTRK